MAWTPVLPEANQVGPVSARSGHSSEPQRNVAKDGSRSVEAVTRDGAAPGRSWSGATSM